ncbi:4-hydroxy-tetrahydrodipicolinate synthase [Paenibacillus massiliensis]|uniref:4-hydroxy-tetrahydrodipicolinate synthase n=1 Tax=Paenibacillus massiliensis TaxID=225917 RepID=UPI0004707865|nr:4-hydroxy-tetrahydrodipicolinate synthase [Paenibacillus massiliensis]
MDFGRLITAMVTPFDEQGEINWEATAQLMDYLIDVQKSESLVISGTTGEAPTLSDEEKIKLFSFAVEKAAGRCKIIAGTGSNNTRHSIHLTQAAERTGVDGVLLVVPYYNKPNQEGIFRHFESIAQATKLPVMLYNVPQRTAVSMSSVTTLRLAQIDNIVATKECVSTEQVGKIVRSAPEGFKVYSGDDSSGLPAMSVGAYGIVSVASHVVGAEMKQMMDAFISGRIEEATKLYGELLPVFKGLFECPNPVAVKYSLELKGLNVGSVRLPLVAPNDSEKALIKQLYE